MSRRFAASAIVLIPALMLAVLTRAQNAQLPRQPGAVYDFDFPNEQSSPRQSTISLGFGKRLKGRTAESTEAAPSLCPRTASMCRLTLQRGGKL